MNQDSDDEQALLETLLDASISDVVDHRAEVIYQRRLKEREIEQEQLRQIALQEDPEYGCF